MQYLFSIFLKKFLCFHKAFTNTIRAGSRRCIKQALMLVQTSKFSCAPCYYIPFLVDNACERI